jgi:MarR family 2-MHQ and catechol resistance regulon transcriptional repressor
MPTHYHGTTTETLALDTYIKFTRASASLESRLAAFGTIDDLTPTQFGVLETLHHLGPLCQGELSAKLLKSTGNMTLVLDNLEKRGLVRRAREIDDRRMIKLHLTPEGEETIQRVFPQHLKSIVAAFEMLSADEQLELGRLCKKLGRGKAV